MRDFERPTVWVDDGDLAGQADETWQALAQWSTLHDPPRVIVNSGGHLARSTERDVEPFDRFSLREEASRAARFAKMDAKANARPVYPPGEVIDALLKRDPREYTDVPRVNAVVDVPVVAPSGEIVAEPGLHPSGILYRPKPGLENVFVEDVEHADEVEWAKDILLHHLLGDFEFKNQASRANALGLVLLPFVRHYIGADPTPMHFVGAPQPGSGKTYLVQAALIPGCDLVGMASEPQNEEELRKLITSGLMRGRPAVVFDNLTTRMTFGTLASALTSRVWQDRVLGQSKEIDIPIRCVWAATGNNIEGNDDLADRVCPIQLNPRGGVPARQRPANYFRHADLHEWATANRAQLVSACLTLVRHWFQGLPRLRPDGTFYRRRDDHGSLMIVQPERSLGSYGKWAQVVGGILAAANVEGFLANVEEYKADMNPEAQEVADFFRAWREHIPVPVTSDDVAQACGPGGVLRPYMPTAIGDRELRKTLRYWLRSRRGQTHQGLTLQAAGRSPMLWQVTENGQGGTT